MAANGRLPRSALRAIPGGGLLRKDCAARFIAAQVECLHRRGRMPVLNGRLSGYRNWVGQVAMRAMWCRLGKCENAAVPGTSNHGWGIAGDSDDAWMLDDPALDEYGFNKRYSDAPWEDWHRKWRGWGRTRINWRLGDRIIRAGTSRGDDIQRLQVLLRRAGHLPRRWKSHRRFTRRVRKAVLAAQKQAGLKRDGIVGPVTIAAVKRQAERKQRKRR